MQTLEGFESSERNKNFIASPLQVVLCAGYVAVRTELEVLVLKLEATSEPTIVEESSENLKNCKNYTAGFIHKL